MKKNLSYNFLRVVFLLLTVLTSESSFCQKSINSKYYVNAYDSLEGMLNGSVAYSFKKAVILTENAYLENRLNRNEFQHRINELISLVTNFKESNKLIYEFKDKESVSTWAAIFKVISDTTYREIGNIKIANYPFRYDFEDFFGEEDWTKMFVSKLLDSGSGNCHSMPFLYKLIAEEMNSTALLALAPNHIYIKHRSIKSGMYNTELTSRSFPIDAWIMASGYIHLTAIQNGVYMKALNDKESIALCLIDLAEGYKRKTSNSDPDFIIKCSDKALEYFPNYVNALILKAETIKSQHDRLSVEYPNPTNEISLKIQILFNQMQDLYVKVHKLGYRQMPKEMYMKWLVELKTEKEKYQNKNVSSYDK